jgi:hypothetical protein
LRVRWCRHGEENAFGARRSWGSNIGMGLSLKKKCLKIFSLALKKNSENFIKISELNAMKELIYVMRAHDSLLRIVGSA